MILIAQDTTSYGIDRGEMDALPNLLEKIEETAPNIPWIRILYAFPGYVSDHLIDLMASENRILPYLDIPLQHADPNTLRRMLRPSDMDSVRRTLDYMRERMPEMAIRSTFITGFPGETEEEFTTLYRFIESILLKKILRVRPCLMMYRKKSSWNVRNNCICCSRRSPTISTFGSLERQWTY